MAANAAVKGKIEGLPELNRKISAMKVAFSGRPVQALTLKAVRPIAAQAKRNARRGPTGKTIQGINAFAGKKAFKFGALAVARAKWRGTGAVFEEWGTKDHGPGKWQAMKISLSKLGATGRGKRAKLTGGFGYLFAKKITGMKGTRFFEAAVEQKMPEAQRIIQQGCKDLIQESIR